MSKYIMCGVIMLLIGVALCWVPRSREARAAENIDDVMQYLAGEAVRMARDGHGMVLDYSEKSIKDVEKVLAVLHEEYRSSRLKTDVREFAVPYGAYIGEVIRRRYPGSKWERDHSIAGKYSYPLHWLDGDVFPVGWCYKRIVNGPEDDVWHKYSVGSKGRGVTPEP